MGVKILVKKLNRVFSVKAKKNKHYDSIHMLLNKLKAKEVKIINKYKKEKDNYKRKKHQRTLSVIRAQQKKAEKLLNI